jgi:hypothetical protein
VPLLRQGLRPQGSYVVSFVYVHAGAPFGKKGDMEMALPKLDMPIGLIEWEVFVPENYSVKATGGNVIERVIGMRSSDEFAAAPVEGSSGSGVGGGSGIGRGTGIGTGSGGGIGPGAGGGTGGGVVGGVGGGIVGDVARRGPVAAPGQIVGRVFDTSGSVLPGVTVDVELGRVRQSATTDGDGVFRLSNLPSGAARLTAHLAGFTSGTQVVTFSQEPLAVNFTLSVGGLAETITVSGAQPPSERKNEAGRVEPPSQNVLDLQRRAAGVLPIRVEVPRAGTSHQFVKPLVIDQAATVSFKYKRR